MGSATHQHGVRAGSTVKPSRKNGKQPRYQKPARPPELQPVDSTATQLAFPATAGAAIALVWSYWPTLVQLAHRWGTDAQYSHGYLVPAFSVGFLVYTRRKLNADLLGSSWIGLLVMLGGLGLRAVGTFYYYDWFEQISLLPCIAGLALVAGGWQLFRWSLAAIAFLAFMIPLPYRVEISMAHPLQHVATLASTYAMQTLGMPAISEGNVILLNDVEIGVVEACSGLRMLVIFFAISTAVALVIDRPLWERLVIVVSAVPIALACNVVRISVTGILHELVGSEAANRFFHDLAGWLMMPLALMMLWIEQQLIARLFITATERKPIPVCVPVDAGDSRRKSQK